MASDVLIATEIDETGPDRPSPRLDAKGKAKLGAFLLLFVVAAVVILATSEVGPAGNPRIENPNPEGSVIVDGVPRNAEPLFGVENWPIVFSVGFLVAASIVLAPLLWKSWRNRKLEYSLVIFGAVAVLAWLDPPANWATFTVYNPELHHFPTTWPWLRFAPSVEPILVIPGYPFYFWAIAFLALGGYKRVVLPRVGPNSFFRRRPRWGVFICGLSIGFLWDFPSELFMIRAGVYFYSQGFGPVVRVGGTHAGLPIIWTFFSFFTIAVIAVLLYRDDDGGSVVTSLARRLPGRRSREVGSDGQPTTVRQFFAALLLLSVAYMIPMGLFSALRVSGVADTPYVGDEWPYPEIMTYDPYSTLEEAGKPGPFYDR